MNPQVPDELISAYFDGEVTPEERAAVERLLADSDDAQRDLNETARLSALLHSFPRESAPGTLVGNVLRQTSQRPLPVKPAAETPAAVAPAPVQPAPLNSHRNLWLQARAAMISIVTTSAVFLIVIYATSNATNQSLARNDLKSAPATSSANIQTMSDELSVAQVAESLSDLPAVEGDDSASSGGLQKRSLQFAAPSAAPTDPGQAESAATPPPPAPASAQPAPAPAPIPAPTMRKGIPELANPESAKKELESQAKRANPKMFGGMSGQGLGGAAEITTELQQADLVELDNYLNPQSNSSFLNDLKTNGIFYTFVPQVADPDSEVPVVDVSVIDLDRGVKEFLVLLEGLQIQRRSQKRVSDGKESAKPSDDELIVVYAVAPAERLAAALEKVEEHRDLYAGWSKQLPLRIASNSDNRLPRDATSPNQAEETKSQDQLKQLDSVTEDMDDVGLAVNALVERGNSINLQGANQSPAAEAGANQQAKNTTRGRSVYNDKIDRSAAESVAVKNSQSAAGRPQENQTGYEVARIQNGSQLPLPQFPLSRFQQPENLRMAPQSGSPRLEQRSEQAALNGSNGRSVRMLFVLHPQVEAASEKQ